jgi:isocitrate dehydrogenase kinase/phosphatase
MVANMNLPDAIAKSILQGFEAMFADFMDVTNGAQGRFEQAQWHEVHAAMRLRLTVYRERVGYAEQHCRDIAGDNLQNKDAWAQVKLRYAEMISDHFLTRCLIVFLVILLYEIPVYLQVLKR